MLHSRNKFKWSSVAKFWKFPWLLTQLPKMSFTKSCNSKFRMKAGDRGINTSPWSPRRAVYTSVSPSFIVCFACRRFVDFQTQFRENRRRLRASARSIGFWNHSARWRSRIQERVFQKTPTRVSPWRCDIVGQKILCSLPRRRNPGQCCLKQKM